MPPGAAAGTCGGSAGRPGAGPPWGQWEPPQGEQGLVSLPVFPGASGRGVEGGAEQGGHDPGRPGRMCRASGRGAGRKVAGAAGATHGKPAVVTDVSGTPGACGSAVPGAGGAGLQGPGESEFARAGSKAPEQHRSHLVSCRRAGVGLTRARAAAASPRRERGPSSPVSVPRAEPEGQSARRSGGPGQPGARHASSQHRPPAHRRAVRALCDHSAVGPGQLSFRRGDVLRVVATVDEDWIRCAQGGAEGLVPVGYTSLVL